MCACVKRPILWSGAFEERKNLAERNISDFENVTYIIFSHSRPQWLRWRSYCTPTALFSFFQFQLRVSSNNCCCTNCHLEVRAYAIHTQQWAINWHSGFICNWPINQISFLWFFFQISPFLMKPRVNAFFLMISNVVILDYMCLILCAKGIIEKEVADFKLKLIASHRPFQYHNKKTSWKIHLKA